MLVPIQHSDIVHERKGECEPQTIFIRKNISAGQLFNLQGLYKCNLLYLQISSNSFALFYQINIDHS
jgi:hypothetical protein